MLYQKFMYDMKSIYEMNISFNVSPVLQWQFYSSPFLSSLI